MPSQVVTKRRVKRRQQRLRLVSKNAKRKVRSVRKHRKTAKKVMRGGIGFEWNQAFSVIDFDVFEKNNPDKGKIPRVRDDVFTLLVKKNMLSNSYSFKFSFDLDKFPEIERDADYTYRGHTIVPTGKWHRKYIAQINSSPKTEEFIMIIERLIQHIGGNLESELPSMVADKVDVDEAEIKRVQAIRGGISEKRLDEFKKDGKVARRCEINMTLGMNKGKTQLLLDDYTAIEETKISTRTFVGTIGNDEDTFSIYKWNNRTPEKSTVIANFNGVVPTPEELNKVLTKLKSKFYLIVKLVGKEEMIESQGDSSKPDDSIKFKNGDRFNGIIKFNNGDTFNGTYTKQRVEKSFTGTDWTEFKNLVLFENGEYTWANGDIYKGTYKCVNERCSKINGTYTWADKTTYTGESFIIDELDGKPKVMVTGFDLDGIVYPTESASVTVPAFVTGSLSEEYNEKIDHPA
jgi:hypothetical protein